MGRDHEINEDYALADSDAGVFIVADGLGGKPRGDLASRAAVEAFFNKVKCMRQSGFLDEGELKKAVEAAETGVRHLAETDPLLDGMSTTLSAAVLCGSHGKIVHIGDSRVYHYRSSGLRLLTRDHNLAEDLLRQNQISSRTAAKSPLRNVLSRCVGVGGVVEADILDFTLKPADLLLLTTDGLGKIMERDSLKRILDQGRGCTARELCEQIMEKATGNPLPDDITLIVVRMRTAS